MSLEHWIFAGYAIFAFGALASLLKVLWRPKESQRMLRRLQDFLVWSSGLAVFLWAIAWLFVVI